MPAAASIPNITTVANGQLAWKSRRSLATPAASRSSPTSRRSGWPAVRRSLLHPGATTCAQRQRSPGEPVPGWGKTADQSHAHAKFIRLATIPSATAHPRWRCMIHRYGAGANQTVRSKSTPTRSTTMSATVAGNCRARGEAGREPVQVRQPWTRVGRRRGKPDAVDRRPGNNCDDDQIFPPRQRTCVAGR